MYVTSPFTSLINNKTINNSKSVYLMAFHIPEELSKNQQALIKEVSKYFTKVYCIHSNNSITKKK